MKFRSRLLYCGDSVVVQTAPDTAAKFLLYGNSAASRFAYEYKMQRDLRRAGVSVPEPDGVRNVTFPLEGYYRHFGKSLPAFVMEFIDGRALCDESWHYDLSLYQTALEAEMDELRKAERLGFRPGFDAIGNSIWSPSERRIYLIDFQHWKK
jgi:hypothetical protein